jgi:hypothetical protein
MISLPFFTQSMSQTVPHVSHTHEELRQQQQMKRKPFCLSHWFADKQSKRQGAGVVGKP